MGESTLRSVRFSSFPLGDFYKVVNLVGLMLVGLRPHLSQNNTPFLLGSECDRSARQGGGAEPIRLELENNPDRMEAWPTCSPNAS